MLKTNSRIHGCWGLVKVHRRVAGDEECPCVDKLILLSPVMDPILTRGGFSEIWCNFFKFNFFNVIFFVETSLGYLGTSPGPIEMVS